MKYGTVHSSGKQLIPLGDSLLLRFSLDQWRKGKFWTRKIADAEPWCKNHYIDRRTYAQQITDAVAEGCQELMICFIASKPVFNGVEDFTENVIKRIRTLGYRNELIITPENEFLERGSTTEYINLANRVSPIVNKYAGCSLSIGGMASSFTGFYEQISKSVTGYKYIDLHTSNDGNLWSLEHLSRILPENKPWICSEHYLWNDAFKKGYDDPAVEEHFKEVTDHYFHNPRVKSVYVLFPSGCPEGHKYKPLLLRTTDKENNIKHNTSVWYLVKLYEKGEEIVEKLRQLKKGDKGHDVLIMQDILVSAGCDPQGVDGVFGEKTAKAVNKYRKKYGLKETGVCSYAVWYFFAISDKTADSIDAYFAMLKVI